MRIKLFAAAVLFTFSAYSQARPSKPNIVLIFSDDAGYADFSFMSNRFIKTPNIDRIAGEGVKFSNGYVTGAVCAPSRSGMLTGINQAEFGNVYNYIQGVKYNIPENEYGIPQNVKLIGNYLQPLGYKSGIIGKWHQGLSAPFQPNSRGFDYFWGFLWGSNGYHTGMAKNVLENNTPVAPNDIEYLTDAIGRKSVDFIEANKQNPFFLFVSFNAVHTPLHSKPEDLALYKDQFPDDNTKLHNAAMTHCLDQNVGKIIQALEKNGLLENTILIFTNDNGGQKNTLHADNYPLRGMKADPWEGGIRVPFAMRWPQKIKPNTVCDYPVTTLDLLPTFINAAGGKANQEKQLKGKDLTEIVSNTPRVPRAHYWQLTKDKGAMREGEWKLILANNGYELYNLEKDISEAENLAFKYPAILKKLKAKYKKWEESLPPLRFWPIDKSSE